jgi:hypothetical protein
MSVPFYRNIHLETTPYTFRGLSMNIKTPQLWAIYGEVFRGGGCSYGLLEWCYDQADAEKLLLEMKKDPGIYCLEAQSYQEWEFQERGHVSKEQRKRRAIERQRNGVKLCRLICKAVESIQAAHDHHQDFSKMKRIPEKSWTELTTYLIELGLLRPLPENPFSVERYDWDRCYWDGLMALLYQIACSRPTYAPGYEYIQISSMTNGIVLAERTRRETMLKCGLPDTSIFLRILAPRENPLEV